MSAWSAFYPYVLPHVTGAPGPLVDQALREAAREFCRESRVWKERTTPQAGTGTAKTFSIVLPVTETELVKIERCTVAGLDHTVKDASTVPQDWLETTEVNALTRTCIQLNDTQFRLYATPASGENIQLYLALTPSDTAAGLADTVYARWGERIAHGAKFRLFSMEGKPWAKPQSVQLAYELFQQAIHDAAGSQFRQNQTLRTGRTIL